MQIIQRSRGAITSNFKLVLGLILKEYFQLMDEKNELKSSFEKAKPESNSGFAKELLDFLAHNKKWWLGPIIVTMLLLGALMMLGGSAAAPFIYTLF